MSGEFHTSIDIIRNILKESESERQNEFNRMSEQFRKTMEEENERRSKQLFDEIRRMSSELVKNLTMMTKTPIAAFKASGISVSTPAVGDILIFPNLLFNHRDVYDNSTGIFTAPLSGLYLFTVQICSTKQKYVTFEIIVNGMKLAQGFANRSTLDYPCVSADAFAVMDVGQTAYVRLVSRDGPIYDDAHRFVSFSGALLNKA